MRRHRRRTQHFHTTKIIFSCNPKKKNKKNTLLAFVLDFLALLPFLRIWVAVVLALQVPDVTYFKLQKNITNHSILLPVHHQRHKHSNSVFIFITELSAVVAQCDPIAVAIKCALSLTATERKAQYFAEYIQNVNAPNYCECDVLM